MRKGELWLLVTKGCSVGALGICPNVPRGHCQCSQGPLEMPTGGLPRQGGYIPSLNLRELGTNEHKVEDALSPLEITVEIDAEKAARPAEGVVASSVRSQDKRAPEGESPKTGAQWVWAGQGGGGRS